MEEYEYTPLGENEIRLLEIQPGPDSDIISCRLQHVSLDGVPKYAALSYTWGKDLATHRICVNGRGLSVNSNLNAALQELRSRPVWFVPDHEHATDAKNDLFLGHLKRLEDTMDRVTIGLSEFGSSSIDGSLQQLLDSIGNISKKVKALQEASATKEEVPLARHESQFIWIDAICINQKDFQERGEQVKLMRQIYRGATSLTVWLGPEENKSNVAFSLLRKFDREGSLELVHEDSGPRRLDAPEVAWLAVGLLFRRPWFTRSWILQEYTLGGHCQTGDTDAITFCCGKDRIFNLVKLGTGALAQKHMQDAVIEDQGVSLWSQIYENVAAIDALRRKFFLKQRSNGATHLNRYQLLPMILMSRKVLATDPRDKIYAFVGLAEELFDGGPADFLSTALIIDYSATVEDVYSSFVRGVVEATNRLDILGACYREQEGFVRRTWTPDWTIPVTVDMLVREIVVSAKPEPHEFNYNPTPGIDCIAKFAPDLSTLTVTGFVWDQIVQKSSTLLPDDPAAVAGFRKDCYEILSQAKEIRGAGEGNLQTEDPNSVLLKIMAWNRVRERSGLLLPDAWLESMRYWIKEERITIAGDEMSSNDMFTVVKTGFPAAVRESIDYTHRVLLTSDGYIGRSNRSVKEKDIICILLGCAVPMVLRQVDSHYELVGEAYVPGIMHGEAMAALNGGEKVLQEFELH